jgi:hypothetical protein
MYMPFAGNHDMMISNNAASMKKLAAFITNGYQQVGKTVKALVSSKPLKWTEA